MTSPQPKCRECNQENHSPDCPRFRELAVEEMNRDYATEGLEGIY